MEVTAGLLVIIIIPAAAEADTEATEAQVRMPVEAVAATEALEDTAVVAMVQMGLVAAVDLEELPLAVAGTDI